MGRVHSNGKGISKSVKPSHRTPHKWFKKTAEELEEHACKLSKKGCPPSQIGVILCDTHGVSSVKSTTGTKILLLFKCNGLSPEVPEDLYNLIKKAVSVRKHLQTNRSDNDAKFRLILVESRIHRLTRHYK